MPLAAGEELLDGMYERGVTLVERPRADARRRWSAPDVALLVVLALAAVAYLAQADHRLEPGNADYYLRNAETYASGHLAHSRYSPGIGLLLTPLVWLTRASLGNMTFVAEVAMVPVAVAGLYLVYRFLRLYLRPWLAVGLVAAFGLGQAGGFFLTGIEAEPAALLAVTGSLLALARGRSGWAVVLGAVAMVMRIALVPFFLVAWLALLVRRPRAALAGLASIGMAVVAHFASGPVLDPSYVAIGTSGIHEGGSGSVVAKLLSIATDGVVTYLRFGLPRLLVPFRALERPVGPLLAALVLGVMVVGLWRLWRSRPRRGADDATWTAGVAVVAFGAILVSLLLWPVRAGESTRFVVPFVAVPLLVLGRGLDGLSWPRDRRRTALAAVGVSVAFLAVTVAPAVSELRLRNDRPQGETEYIHVHRQAADRFPAGPVLSRKPAYTELVTGRKAYGFPVSNDGAEDIDLARRLHVCTVVLDELAPVPATFSAWVAANQRQVLARQGATAIVTLAVPGC